MNNVEDKSEDDNGKDEFNGNNREWKDHQDEHMMDVSYCGCQMKVLYQSGWFTIEVKNYNDQLQKYYIKLTMTSNIASEMTTLTWSKHVNQLIPLGLFVESLNSLFSVQRLSYTVICFKVCDWIYFPQKLLLYSEDGYTAICLKIVCVFSVSHFCLCFAFRCMAWS